MPGEPQVDDGSGARTGSTGPAGAARRSDAAGSSARRSDADEPATGSGMLDRELVRISKRLSKVLRHAPESVGLTLDAQGWVPVDELLAALGRHGRPVGAGQLRAVVAGNDKQRFALRTGPDGVVRIRASQGHSARVAVDLGLLPAVPPEQLYHGTSPGLVPAILAEGLRPGRRHHVHLSTDVATAVRVGRRRPGAVSVLVVRAAALADGGHPFYRSDNGVWLTPSVPPDFVSPVDAAELV